MTGHARYMQVALALARRNLGQTWPNPSVGAVVVKNGQIISQGYTARGGRPHAEAQALAQDAQGAILYVTLEPCSHQGKTPPCTQAIIQAGIAQVVIACRDPNPQVNGQGVAQLRAAGIEVIEDVCGREAAEINCGFFSVIQKKRPFISIKLASSLDGKIATSSGQSQWITGEAARAFGHLLRSRYDAIATGIGTVLADNPMLTCRLPGLEDRSPVRVVFDRDGRLPGDSALARTTGGVPVWVLSDGVERAVETLAERGITRLLVEAGPTLSTAFLQSELVDRIYWFRAPVMIGLDGRNAIGDGFAAELEKLERWRLTERRVIGNDSLDILECSPASSAA